MESNSDAGTPYNLRVKGRTQGQVEYLQSAPQLRENRRTDWAPHGVPHSPQGEEEEEEKSDITEQDQQITQRHKENVSIVF